MSYRLHRRAVLAAPLGLLLSACTPSQRDAPSSVVTNNNARHRFHRAYCITDNDDAIVFITGADFGRAITTTVADQRSVISVSPIMIPGLTLAPARPDLFWVPDEPKELSPLAFGVLPRESEPGPQLAGHGYDLAILLPQMPVEADVYVVGAYPDDFAPRFKSIVTREWRRVGVAPPLFPCPMPGGDSAR